MGETKDVFVFVPCRYFVVCADGALGCEFTQENCTYFTCPSECPLYEKSEPV